MGCECHNDFRQSERYTVDTYKEIIEWNLRKTHTILEEDSSLPNVDAYLEWKGEDILSKQIEKMDREGCLFVLNTSVFIFVDYSPSRFCVME